MGPSSHPCFTSLANGVAETNGITCGVVSGEELELDPGLLAAGVPVETSLFVPVIDPSDEAFGEIFGVGDKAVEIWCIVVVGWELGCVWR